MGPDGFTFPARQLNLTDIHINQSGTYLATFINDCGAISSQSYFLNVSTSDVGDAYDWPSYYSTLDYNFREEFPALSLPHSCPLNVTADGCRTILSEGHPLKE